MPRKSPPLEIAEISGDRYPDLATAQKLALTPLAGNLAESIRGLVAAGKLVIEDGRLIVSENGDSEHV